MTFRVAAGLAAMVLLCLAAYQMAGGNLLGLFYFGVPGALFGVLMLVDKAYESGDRR